MFILLINISIRGAFGNVVEDVPYRNQVLDFPNWYNNQSSCGYTCVLMALLYIDMLPEGKNEQDTIISLDTDCSAAGPGSYYGASGLQYYCDKHFPGVGLQTVTYYEDCDKNVKSIIDEGWPAITGTNIYGNVGHVILVVGYDETGWIVNDPAGEFCQSYLPPGGPPWGRAAYVHYSYGSFGFVNVQAIKYANNKKLAAKVESRSPDISIINDDEVHELWIKLKNTGKEDWKKEEIHLSTINTNDRNCGLIDKKSQKSNRWISSNRIKMEQDVVKPDQVATFVFPVSRNGFVGELVESFRLIKDTADGGRFGPSLHWRIICKQNGESEQFNNSLCFNDSTASLEKDSVVYYHRGLMHLHSNYSDGKLSIDELAKEGKKLGLKYMIVSDHLDSFDSWEKYLNYLGDINKAANKNGICLTAALEYTITNVDGKISDPHDSTVHLLGIGYNSNSKNPIIPEEFVPWSEKGYKYTAQDIIGWHQQKNLPLIICHPINKGRNGQNSEELILQGKLGDSSKITSIEFFDIGFDTYNGMLTKSVWQKIDNPDIEFGKTWKLYNIFLATAGVGVTACSDYHGKIGMLGSNFTLDWNTQDEMRVGLFQDKLHLGKIDPNYGKIMQSLDRAKTTICSLQSKLSVCEVVEALRNKRTVASRYHETLDWIKIEDKVWAPGKWSKIVQTGRNPIISFAIQFHEGNNSTSEDRNKLVMVVRDGKVIKNTQVAINSQQKLEYAFNDNGLKTGIHSYIFLICGGEKNDWSREKIITSPFYLEVKDENITNSNPQVEGNKKILTLFKNRIHLGDSNYPMDQFNNRFEVEKDEGKVGTWGFILKEQDYQRIVNCQLVINVTGAELEKIDNRGNPIYINGQYVMDCILLNNDPKNNKKDHSYQIPVDKLQLGYNEIMIRSFPHYYPQGGTGTNSNIDFDDFELKNIRLVWENGVNKSAKTLSVDNYIASEIPESEVVGNKFTLEEIEKSVEIINNFEDEGGKFLPETDRQVQVLNSIVAPLHDNLDKFQRYEKLTIEVYESDNIDPVALPDGTILVPTGLIDMQQKDLPETILFPIISAMQLADSGISMEEAKRADTGSILNFVGNIFDKISGGNSEAGKYVKMGLKLAEILSMKMEKRDYFMADADALDVLKEIGLDSNDGFSWLDAVYSKQMANKDRQMFLFSPQPEERLKALQTYYRISKSNQYLNQMPISPEEFDWEKVIKEYK